MDSEVDRESGAETAHEGEEGLGAESVVEWVATREVDAMEDLRRRDATDLAERLLVETRLRQAAEARCVALEVETKELWEQTRFLQRKLTEARDAVESGAMVVDTKLRVAEEDAAILHRSLERGFAEAVAESVRRAVTALEARYQAANLGQDLATLSGRNQALVRMLEVLADRLDVSERECRAVEREKAILESEREILLKRGGNRRFLAHARTEASTPPRPEALAPGGGGAEEKEAAPGAATVPRSRPQSASAASAARTAALAQGAAALLGQRVGGGGGEEGEGEGEEEGEKEARHTSVTDAVSATSLGVEDRSRVEHPNVALRWVQESPPPKPRMMGTSATSTTRLSTTKDTFDALLRSSGFGAGSSASPTSSPIHRRAPAVSPLAKSLRESRGKLPNLSLRPFSPSPSSPDTATTATATRPPPPPPPPSFAAKKSELASVFSPPSISTVHLSLPHAESRHPDRHPSSPSTTSASASAPVSRPFSAMPLLSPLRSSSSSGTPPAASPIPAATHPLQLRGQGFLTALPGATSPTK